MAKNDIHFEEPSSTQTVNDVSAQDESRMYESAVPKSPNSFFAPIGKLGYLSWQADNSAAVLALLMFCLLLAVLVIVAIIAAFCGGPAWASKAVELIGQAMLAIVGAVLGAGAASKK